jgi:Fic family protein
MIRQPLYKSEEEKVRLIERNLLLQYERVLQLARESAKTLRLTPEVVRELHRLAMQDIYSCAGQFPTWSIRIIGSQHTPPEGDRVEGLVQDMCEKANEDEDDLVHTAAFLLWKLNWIHPFGGGNGRTSRALAYLSTCARIQVDVPGRPTIAVYIDRNRNLYLDALMDADAAWQNSSVVDVSKMRSLLDDWLRKQISPPRPSAVKN